jgi:hypothetical protein
MAATNPELEAGRYGEDRIEVDREEHPPDDGQQFHQSLVAVRRPLPVP